MGLIASNYQGEIWLLLPNWARRHMSKIQVGSLIVPYTLLQLKEKLQSSKTDMTSNSTDSSGIKFSITISKDP